MTPNDKKTFQSILLLDYVQKSNVKTILNGDDKFIEPLLIELMSKGYVRTSGMSYEVTDAGNTVYDNFNKRYQEYLKIYDVFAFVDLDSAEFAFDKYFDFKTDEEWESFKQNPRFEDLRVAVALFKKLNPAEIVFMSFINEGRLDTSSTGWQLDLLSDRTWLEIDEICNTALMPGQLGDDAMIDIIEQGSKIVVALLQEEQKRNQEQAKSVSMSGTQTEIIEETVVEEGYYGDPYYYESYYDPFYISPFWCVPLFLW